MLANVFTSKTKELYDLRIQAYFIDMPDAPMAPATLYDII